MNLSDSSFDFIDCYMTRQCMMNGCWAMDKTHLWEWLRVYEVNPANGFMFADDHEINVISNMMDSSDAPIQIGHSGASFGITMRNLHYIAKNGFDAYKTQYLENKRRREQEQEQETTGND